MVLSPICEKSGVIGMLLLLNRKILCLYDPGKVVLQIEKPRRELRGLAARHPVPTIM